MASDGEITFSTALDNAQLEKDLKRAEADIEKLKAKVENAKGGKSAMEGQLKRGREAAAAMAAEVDRLRGKLNSMAAKPVSTREEMDAYRAEYTALMEQYKQASGRLSSLRQSNADLSREWTAATSQVARYTEQLASARTRQAELATEMQAAAAKSAPAWQRAAASIRARLASAAESGRQAMASAAQRSAAPWENLGARIGKMMRKVFVFGVILAGLRAIKSSISGMLAGNERFQASVQNLKAVINGFLSSIVSAVLPALTSFVNMLAGVFERIAGLIDSVFGSNIAGAIQAQRAAASAQVQQGNAEKRAAYEQQAARAAEREAKAQKGLAKATKEANRELMSFDELNTLSAEDVEDAADAMEDYGDAVAEPGYDADWTQMPGLGDAGMFQGVLDWLDMLRDRIENDAEGPFARIREGLALIGKGWGEVVEGFRTGDLGLIWRGIGDIVIGALYVIEGAFGAFMDWLDEMTGGRFHDVFEGLKLIVHGFVEVVEGLLRGDLPLAFQGLVDIVEGAALLLHGAVDAVLGLARMGVEAFFAYLSEKFPELAPLFGWLKGIVLGVLDALGTVLHGWVDAAKLIIEGALDIIMGILTLDGERVKKGVEEVCEGIRTSWEGMVEAVQIILSTAFDALRSAIGGAFDYLAEQFPEAAGLFEWLKDSIIGGLEAIEGFLHDMLDGALQVLEGSLDFIVGLFTLNGDLIAQGLQEICDGMVEMLDSAFRTVVNGVIWLLNQALDGVGWFVNSIADGVSGIVSWLGGGGMSFHVDMPQIPYLASGAVIPPNREFLAVLGDQASGNNLEAPEALIRQIVREEAGGGISPEAMAVLMAILQAVREGQAIYVDGQVLGRTARREIETMERMGGF